MIRPRSFLVLFILLALPVFAQQPDTLLYSIPAPPAGAQSNAGLGESVAVDGSLTVVGAPYDGTGGTVAGVVKVFDTASGALLHVILNPSAGIGNYYYFGTAVAVSGARVVVGAYSYGSGVGRAYVYDLSSATPTVPVATLNNPTPADYDYFGGSVAIFGTRVVVGASGDDTGATGAGSAYVYDLNSATPDVPVATLNNPSPTVNGSFGYTVAISDTRVVVGLYIFDLNSATPTVPVLKLDGFGSSVAISGTRVVLGASGDDTGATDAGSARVYDLSSSTPTVPIITLNNPSPAYRDFFGASVAISGTRLVVGMGVYNRYPTEPPYNAGVAYIYDLSSGTPAVPVATLNNPTPPENTYVPGDTDLFGSSVAISGTRVVVGAEHDSTRASRAGSAYVYDLNSATPTVPAAILDSPSPSTGDAFGTSVAIDASYMVVGAYLEDVGAPNAGSAYVYDLSSDTPTVPVVTLNNPNPAPLPPFPSGFGFSVAVSGTLVVVGDYYGKSPGDEYWGAAYVYDLSSETPAVPLVKLNNPKPSITDWFGRSVAISGTRVVVGAYYTGSAYVYDLSSSTPTVPVVTLNNPSPEQGDDFGLSVAISGSRVVVGASRDNTGAEGAGSAYVYDLNSATPTVPVATLNNPSPGRYDLFGSSVAISGARVAVGAHSDSAAAYYEGSAYVYDLSSDTPTVPVATLNNPSPAQYDYFGRSVSISGTRVIVGSDAGGAYVYDLNSGSPTVPVTSTNFGASVAISGTTAVIGPFEESVRVFGPDSTVTQPPVLTAPANGERTSSPVMVSFSLPENAQSGSVKLSFGETILTLAATQESAGAHSFSFDPANPTASPQIANATGPLADGSYLVRLSYQDANANPAASDTSSQVTIDRVTLPPLLLAPAANTTPTLPVQVSYTLPETPKAGTIKLAFGPHVLTMSALGEKYGGGNVAFSFNPAIPTASPYIASGPRIPPGVYPVTLSYQDARGNPVVSDTSSEVTINTSPVLLAPAANTMVTSPVKVHYALPEMPKSGTVRLTFGSHVLTVSALGEAGSVGGVEFSFDPANPTASPYIASGAPIPDGVYAVTLSYQDAQGNVIASDTNSAVTIDRVTSPPVLLAPAANATLSMPVQVSYTLPEAPLAGSVKLAFGSHVLTMSALGEVAGVGGVAFSFDPANPTASPYIASGSPIPDGVYAVTLSYQDANWNSAASDTSIEVTIDRVTSPPVLLAPAANTTPTLPVQVSYTLSEAPLTGTVKLAFGPHVLTMSALGETFGGGSGVAFNFDPKNPTASPYIASGSPIPDGVYAVTLSYQDAQGHPAASDTSSQVTLDTVTSPPVLLAPAANTTFTSFVQVNYVLPDMPKAGTVKLAFGPHVLTMSGLGETYGGGNVTFRFSRFIPTSSPYIASGSAIPDGVYEVTLSYQAANGDAVASATSSGVKIDGVTLPPVLLTPAANTTPELPVQVSYTLPEVPQAGTVKLAFGPNVLTMSALGETSGVGGVAFSFDPANPTASPYIASGSPIPDGLYAVTLSYRDHLGNALASTTNVNVTIGVVPEPPEPGNTVLYGEGSEVPASAGLPAGAVWRKFGVPAVNAAGDVVFNAEWTDASGKGAAVFETNSATDELKVVIQRGARAPAPGPGAEPLPTEAVVAKLRDPIVASNGDVLTPVTLAGKGITPTNDAALIWSPRSNFAESRVVVREGQLLADGKVKAIRGAEVGSAGVAFTATLAGKGITPATDSIACVWTPLDGAVPVVREGQFIYGMKLKHFNTLGVGANALGHGRGMAPLESAPLKLGFLGKFSEGPTAVMALAPGGVLYFLITTDHAFGAYHGAFKSLGLPAWARQLTSSVFLGTMDNGTEGVFQYHASTDTIQPLAVIGAEIESNLRLKTAKDPVVSSDGTSKGWVGTVKGPKVTAANDQVLAFADGTNLSIVAREGTPAVDAPEGARWKSFQSLAMPARGPLFLGSLQRGPGRITSANDVGVWGMDSSGALHCLFREGDMIAGKKLKTHTVLKAVSGTPGVTRAWNDAGQVVWLATFTDGSTAIIKTQVP